LSQWACLCQRRRDQHNQWGSFWECSTRGKWYSLYWVVSCYEWSH